MYVFFFFCVWLCLKMEVRCPKCCHSRHGQFDHNKTWIIMWNTISLRDLNGLSCGIQCDLTINLRGLNGI